MLAVQIFKEHYEAPPLKKALVADNWVTGTVVVSIQEVHSFLIKNT